MNEILRQGLVVGLFLSAGLGLTSGCASSAHDKDEIKISMAELPDAVKPLAEKEVAGCEVKEVEKELEDGRVIYAITYLDKEGILMELEYAEDGTLTSKEEE